MYTDLFIMLSMFWPALLISRAQQVDVANILQERDVNPDSLVKRAESPEPQ